MASPSCHGDSRAGTNAPREPTDKKPPVSMHHCSYCKVTFRKYDDLIQHKKQRLIDEFQNDGADGVLHNFCHICDKDFIARDAMELHWAQHHAKHQNINCPACHEHFPLFSSFVKHIELASCPKISQETAAARAEFTLSMTQELSFIDPDRRKDFAKYLGRGTQTLERASYSTAPKDAWTQAVAAEEWQGSPPAAPKAEDFPKQEYRNYLNGNNNTPDYLTGNEAGGRQIGDGNTNAWASGKRLFANVGPAPKPSTDQLQKLEWLQADYKAQMELASNVNTDPDHPDSKFFDARRYLDPYLQKYKCPRGGCKKSFKSADALKGHLKSEAHLFVKKVTCPSCLATFQALYSLAAHVESASKKCGIRHSEFFAIFLGQLTWNLVEATGTHAEDGTTKYEIAKMAQEDYGVSQPSQPKPTFGHQQIHGFQNTVQQPQSAAPSLATQQDQAQHWDQQSQASVAQSMFAMDDTLLSFDEPNASDLVSVAAHTEGRELEEQAQVWGGAATSSGWGIDLNEGSQQDHRQEQQESEWTDLSTQPAAPPHAPQQYKW